jgi:hypothetical protein
LPFGNNTYWGKYNFSDMFFFEDIVNKVIGFFKYEFVNVVLLKYISGFF